MTTYAEWFQFREKCLICGLDVEEGEIKEKAPFYHHGKISVCPNCKTNRIKCDDGHFRSIFIGYAVHKGCGKWHPVDTPCQK